MCWFRKRPARQDLQAQIDACRSDIDALNKQLGAVRGQLEGDLGALRKDFQELIAFLKENAAEAGTETEGPGDATGGGENKAVLHSDLTDLVDRVGGIGRKIETFDQALVQIHTVMDAGFGDVKKQINDTSKEIVNRISFAVSRLRA